MNHDNLIILVVEDNPLNRKLVRSVLELEGIGIVEAEDAEQGIEECRRQRPDLVLMDIQLPGMDGLEATRIIKSDSLVGSTPVVALTSHAMDGDEQKAYQAGCQGYIAKPIDTDTFLTTVLACLPDNDQTQGETARNGNELQKVTREVFEERRYRKSILVVDDDPRNVKLLCGILSSRHYDLKTAFDGETALNIVAEQAPELILLDIMMPGIDGFEVTRRLKSDPETKSIPIILITALSNYRDKIKGLEAGADEFLNKPVNTEELLARVHSLLKMKEYQERLATRRGTERTLGSPAFEGGTEDSQQAPPLVLVVEDNDKDFNLLEASMHNEPYRQAKVGSAEAALAFAQREHVDLVLLDIMLPGMDGFTLCERLRSDDVHQHTQIVALTSLRELSYKIRGFEVGFDDYLVKPINFEELKARIRALLRKKAYLDQLLCKYNSVFHQAVTDQLTGLYHNSYFKHFLEMDMQRAERQGYPIAVVMIDVDNFKQVNDSFGHVTGDLVLKEISRVIEGCVRVTDVASRYGGEEFALILPYTDQDQAMAVAERICGEVREHEFCTATPENSIHVTVSMGIAIHPWDASSPDELIHAADRALYVSKERGKDCCTLTTTSEGFWDR